MTGYQSSKTSRTVFDRRKIMITIATVALLVITCSCNGSSPEGTQPASQPTQTSPAQPTHTSPAQPTRTPPAPPNPEPTTDPNAGIWNTIKGMWSGCPADVGGGQFLDICPTGQDFPIGPFITLYLPPSCNIGEACGVYVKGAFSSEFIAFELTLEGYIQGRAQFYADSGTGMYEGLDRTLYISLLGGQLSIEESLGENYLLSPGCNPLILDEFGCMDMMPG